MKTCAVTLLLLSSAMACQGPPGTGDEHEGHAGGVKEAPSPSGHRHEASATNAMPAPSAMAAPVGYAKLDIDPARAAAMGLATAPVEHRTFRRSIRTAGIVGLDEIRTSHVHSKVRGWIETVTANFVGKSIKAGTPLCTIYSQEVYAAQLEFLSVLDQTPGRSSGSGAFAEAERSATERLVAAARRRLSLWDVPESQVRRLEQSRRPERTFTLVAPRSGIIVSKQAIAGTFIDPGTELYVVSDVTHLWMIADVYAADVPWLRLGAPASLRVEGLEAEPMQATVGFMPPTIDEATRTLKVRFELDNEAGRIRPGAFATVEMGIELGSSLALPEGSVIHTGDRAIVFVVSGSQIEPRAVDLGPIADGHYRVRRGVSEGERVAVGAQFLIDSESRLRASSTPGAQQGHVGH
ncbi:MAG TPA: efflux RND transporter periplasmic adaptor subunit [Polyangiaceae bacterium]|nr:efflux RND transporter periplasmic adaptor subunit [Polyangiaceae bacterium]